MISVELSPGVVIAGRYRLVSPLGEGGMGSVWAATHTLTRRNVAMKFLLDELRDRPEIRKRFLREATAASALRHPNVVEILDAFECEDLRPVIVMERFQGETLGHKLARDERLSVEETAAILLPVVSAVGTAHAMGIVHRDIKPDNIFLATEGDEVRVKVLDFGIAKLVQPMPEETGTSKLVTNAGAMLGTPCYMAPEQATGDDSADHRADIWSIGVLLYECLSGVRPIEGENLAQVMARLMSAGIIPLERLAPELPAELSALVMRMLSREVGRRPVDLRDVREIVARYSRVKAPPFGEPNSLPTFDEAAPVTMDGADAPASESFGTRSSSPPADSEPAAIAGVRPSRQTDAQAVTLLSAPPPVETPVDTVPSRRRRRVAMGVAAAGVVLGALMLRVGVEPATESAATHPPPPAQDHVSDAPQLPPAHAEPVPAATTVEDTAVPTPSASEPRPASKLRPAAAPRVRAPARPVTDRTAGSAAKSPRTAPVTSATKGAAPAPTTHATRPGTKPSEQTLFSGRK